MRKTDGRKSISSLSSWHYVTWKDAERLMLEKSAAMTFRDRLLWLEQASETTRRIQNASKKKL